MHGGPIGHTYALETRAFIRLRLQFHYDNDIIKSVSEKKLFFLN